MEESTHCRSRCHQSHKLFESVVRINLVKNRDKVNVLFKGPVEAEIRIIVIIIKGIIVILVMVRALAF